MHGIQTAPPRLFATHVVVNVADDHLPERLALAPAVIDLAHVRAVRAKMDDEGDVSETQSIIEAVDDSWRVESPLSVVVAAWQAYRTHADALTRLRN